LNLPRNLLNVLRTDPSVEVWPKEYLGNSLAPLGYFNRPFITFNPTPPKLSPMPNDPVEIQHDPLDSFHAHFAKLLYELTSKANTHMVVLNLPVFRDRAAPAYKERMDWTQFFNGQVPVIGNAPTHLFGKLSTEEIKLLYWNNHMNENGAKYFTRAVTPQLLAAFPEETHDH
jgi:hypothetical protein